MPVLRSIIKLKFKSQLAQRAVSREVSETKKWDETKLDAGLNASRETTGEDCLWESKFYVPFPKTGMQQIEQFNDLILRILRFLAESSEVTQLELFQRFPF